jgi:SAM-dependent methyltransferase
MVTEKAETDPVSAYDLVAPSFALLASQRREYLDAVDRLVIAHLPPGAGTLLDVGAGDARRARRIAAAARIDDFLLVEPSEGMRRAGGPSGAWLDLRAENLHRLDRQFDIILCLWNVVGHVFPRAARLEAMRQFRRLLKANGRAFIDVNHRYNAAQYGVARTAGRWLHDKLHPSERNGDVIATWRLPGAETSVRGHVFTGREFAGLAREAELRVERRFVVDYKTGRERRLAIQGNLLYVMSPS